jgi:hypothetical protein
MTINSNNRWTEDEDRQLLEMKAAGKPNYVIARAIERTGAAVEQRLYRLRLRERKRLGAQLLT